jgi:hypothetical protein
LADIHVALFTTGYPYVDAVVRAIEITRRHGASFSRSIGEPFSLRRDTFARWFLESGGTHALLLEDDVVPPEDALERLLRVESPVAAAVYPRWIDGRLTTNVQAIRDRGWSARVPARVFPVRRCALGCVLVRREVFERVPPPWFITIVADDRFVEDDEWFCDAVRRAGMRILCDGTVVCAAVRQGTDLLSLTRGSIRSE